jgi:hypothetical protein
MDKSKETVPVEAEFVRFLNELEDKPKGMSMTELDVTPPHGGEFEIPQGPAFINGRWEL